MSRACCECPHCRRQFPVKWGFETLGITRVGEEDGAVLTDSDDMYATRVVYLRSVRCPHCGARFRTWNCWFGSTLWVRDYNSMEPVMDFRFCPNCGEELERSGSDGTD